MLALDGGNAVTFGALTLSRTDNTTASITLSSAITGSVFIDTDLLTGARAQHYPDGDGTYVLTSNDDGTLAAGSVTNTMLAGSIANNKLANSSITINGNAVSLGGSVTISGGATLAGNAFTGLQQFTGTDHAGLRLNNLTTVQRDALASPAAGMVIWNSTDGRMQLHNGSAWTSGMVRLAGDTMTGSLGLPNSVTINGVAAGTLQLGVDHASSATAQVLKAHNVTTGTGASLTLAGGTGSTAGGSVSLATSATTAAPVARVTALASGDVTLGSTSAGYLLCSSNTITGGFGNSTSGRPILRMAAGQGSSIHAVVGGISGSDAFSVASPTGTSNVAMSGIFSSNTALTFTISAANKDATGSYTGAGHTTAIIGGRASSVTTGGAGGALTLTGGAAAGSGNNNGGDVTVTGGAATGTGTRGNVLIPNLPTSSAGLPSNAIWNDGGTIKIVP
jgi:hypothetical protein